MDTRQWGWVGEGWRRAQTLRKVATDAALSARASTSGSPMVALGNRLNHDCTLAEKTLWRAPSD